MRRPAAASTGTAPRVVVAIPAHNAERYLAEAIESVLAQSYRDWHLVVADNASSDGTAAVAGAAAAANPGRVTAIATGRNAGAGGGRNAAVAAGPPSELVAFLDADDYWRPDYLEHQVRLYDEARGAGRGVGVVSCNAVIVEDDGPTSLTYRDLLGPVAAIDWETMIERSHVFVSAMVPRRLFDELGGFSEEPWGAEDYDLWLRILERGYDVVSTDEPVAFYRYHPQAMSTSMVTMGDAALIAYRRALARNASDRRRTRAIRSRMRHYRALRARAVLQRALAERRWRDVSAAAALALGWGAVAIAQDPSRWGEWLGDALRAARKPSGPGPRRIARS